MSIFDFKLSGKGSMDDLDDLILRLNEDELRRLHHKIIERLKLIGRTRAASSMARFNVGDRVSFKYQGRLIGGTVTRLNSRTVSLMSDERHEWRVAPDFLSKVVE